MAGKKPHGDTWGFWEKAGPLELGPGYRAWVEPCRCYVCCQCEGGERTEASALAKLDYGVDVSRAVAVGCGVFGWYRTAADGIR